MRFSVIVCSYGGQEQLVEQCIDSLERQTRLPDEVLLVVDTAGEQANYSALLGDRKPVPIEVVSSGKRGLAAARNRGVEAANGDVIAFIDDDAVADERWLAELERSFAEEVKVAGGPVKPIFRGKELNSKLNWIIDCTTTSPPPKRPIGCNMAFRSSVFETVGGFDERLGMVRNQTAVGEETELLFRIKKQFGQDVKIIFNPNATVYHVVPEERTKLKYMLRRAYAEGRAKSAMGKEYDLNVEQMYLTYYLRHLDMTMFLLLLAAGLGYLRGIVKR